jgi:hypothetical protein
MMRQTFCAAGSYVFGSLAVVLFLFTGAASMSSIAFAEEEEEVVLLGGTCGRTATGGCKVITCTKACGAFDDGCPCPP